MVYLKRAISVVLFLIPLLTLFSLVLIFYILGSSIGEAGVLSTPPVLVLILILIFLSGWIVLKTFRPVLEGRMVYTPFKGWALVGYFTDLLVSLAVLTLLALFSLSLFNDSPPQLFPLNDSRATYTLTFEDGLYYLKYDSTSNKNTSIDCSFGANGGKICQNMINNHETVLVGDSPVELSPWVGKPLKVEGNFVYTTRQCIVSKCQSTGNYLAISLVKVELLH